MPKTQQRIPTRQERPNKPLEESQKRPADKPSSENKMMIDVLEHLKADEHITDKHILGKDSPASSLMV